MKIRLLAVLVLCGCANHPKFQKISNDIGYSVNSLSENNDRFQVTVSLPSNTLAQTIEDYAVLAIGEECSAKGYSVWDFGKVSPNNYEGQCYKINEFKGLGLAFYKEGLEKMPKQFIVEIVSQKSSAQIVKDDEVLTIDDNKVISMAQIKSILHSKKDSAAVKVSVKRNNRIITITEPLVTYKDLMLDNKELIDLRKRFN